MSESENERGFTYLRTNQREGKPRTRGITEIRGPYYTPTGKRYLEDILETMGVYVDSLKFAGGSFTLMPKKAISTGTPPPSLQLDFPKSPRRWRSWPPRLNNASPIWNNWNSVSRRWRKS